LLIVVTEDSRNRVNVAPDLPSSLSYSQFFTVQRRLVRHDLDVIFRAKIEVEVRIRLPSSVKPTFGLPTNAMSAILPTPPWLNFVKQRAFAFDLGSERGKRLDLSYFVVTSPPAKE
jgi:hypothetical protein